MKSWSQDVILLECLDISRPIKVRNVGTSGTNGVGEGIAGRAFRENWRMVWFGRLVWMIRDGRPRRRELWNAIVYLSFNGQACLFLT